MSTWTDDRVRKLRTLWIVNDKSAAEIAKILGGVTRNAVLGKLHRLGLTGRKCPQNAHFVPRRRIVEEVNGIDEYTAPSLPGLGGLILDDL